MSSVKFYTYVMSTSKYGRDMPSLVGVENSVKELEDAFTYQNADIYPSKNKTHVEALDELDKYLSEKHFFENDVLLFYYCGHGNLKKDGKTLLLGTTDTSSRNAANIGVEFNTVVDQIKSRVKNYILILDCCHSAVVTEMGTSSLGAGIDDIAEKLSMGGGVYVTSTSRSAQTAKEIDIDGTKYAAFTHYFAQSLLNGISNHKAFISIEELINETERLMNQSSQKENLPPPKIKCINGFDSVDIFRNPSVDQLIEVERKRFIPDKEREKIFPPQSRDSELVFGLVGAFGTDLEIISSQLKASLANYGYTEVDDISISKSILRDNIIQNQFLKKEDYYHREDCLGRSEGYKQARYLMELGTEIRFQMGNDFLAMGVVNLIANKRRQAGTMMGKHEQVDRPRHAYIIHSLKHPDEVNLLRDVYGNGFYLFGIYEDAKQRRNNMRKKLNDTEADELMSTDEKECYTYGQQARKTYQMADFFVNYTEEKQVIANINRILNLIFGEPFITPTFGEYAMFMAWCASLRSADLSRQIGAVVCKNKEVLTTGANDCPSSGGGLYWLLYDNKENKYVDVEDGRDYKRKRDTNKAEFVNIVRDLFGRFNIPETPENFKRIRDSSLGNLTEYGRVVHAEMEAILACARNNISCRGADLYVTTFPCHNCAKHIIAAGFRKVVYIEAYPKSKTFEFYKESITSNINEPEQCCDERGTPKVIFAPFFGVGPRRFIDMFAMNANLLPDKIRKEPENYMDENFLDNYGKKRDWDAKSSFLRFQMPTKTHIEREVEYSNYYIQLSDAFKKFSE